jgi:hypothetical protein
MNEASQLQIIGSMCFGALIGWYVYYINRYRKNDVQLGDLVTLIGVLGGSAVLSLFPSSTDLFGAYGIGLAIGFFGYFLALIGNVALSRNFDVDWFLDGRRTLPNGEVYVPQVDGGGIAMLRRQHEPPVVPPAAG